MLTHITVLVSQTVMMVIRVGGIVRDIVIERSMIQVVGKKGSKVYTHGDLLVLIVE